MRGRALASLALAAAGVSCAKVAMPPGGEIDRDPPTISDSAPPSGAHGVAPDSAFVITFSEPPDRRSVMRALTVIPAVDFAVSSWEETTLRLVPESGWAPDRPTLIAISGRAKDRRDNEMGKPFRTRFTTRAVPDTGLVTGRVWSGREVPNGSALTLGAYDAAEADSVDPVRQDPWALAEASGTGEFRLEGLDTGRKYRVVAMVDRDGDQRPESSGEPWTEAPEMAVFLSPDEHEVRLPDFLLGTLDSLGTIAGEIRADSFAVAVIRAVGAAGGFANDVLPGGGKFELEVPTGDTYRVSAFLDADADTLAGEDEPVVEHEEDVPLLLTARQDGIRLDLIGLLPPPDSLLAPAESTAAPPGAPADSAASGEPSGGSDPEGGGP